VKGRTQIPGSAPGVYCS